MNLVIRSNYGDDSIALIEFIRQRIAQGLHVTKAFVVDIDTGWAAATWPSRIAKAKLYVQQCGFEVVSLSPKMSFPELVNERKSFPNTKFQWCAGFLKGLPLLDWLDEYDPAGEWVIALPKRQSLYRISIAEVIKECPYHGERDVWHPLHMATDTLRDHWLQQAGFTPLLHRSLECSPCVNSTRDELANLHVEDKAKMAQLESQVQKPMFGKWGFMVDQCLNKAPDPRDGKTTMDGFTMGCGDPFGCGL